MAQLFPTLENIKALKVPPTPGEWFLLNYLTDKLPQNVEVYFQPQFNGDMPDIILMGKEIGVTIIEVKDWDLSSYHLDEQANWHVNHNNAEVKSPFEQVFSYKDIMFNLHINGLLEKKILNNKFYGRINAFVYFHGSSSDDIKRYYDKVINNTENKIEEYSELNKANITSNSKKLSYLYNFKKKLYRQRDYYSATIDNIKKITLPKKIEGLFPNSIYQEFHRYLQPPFHTIEQGRHIQYTNKQRSLSISKPKHQKIKGVAGSGKTIILAKRAVNSHRRHNEHVLILTFNITLTSYIHDMISDVRENFDWKNFTIVNYHQFFNSMANNHGLPINGLGNYLDENFFDKAEITKYKSIFIDEIQDYHLSWIKIIKKYFLEDDGELVVFGDEKQNIYQQTLDSEKFPVTTIVGGWNKLTQSFRMSSKIADLAECFQDTFFDKKYVIDEIEIVENTQQLLNFEHNTIKQLSYEDCENESLIRKIYEFTRAKDIHPNDICILAQNIELLRNIDHIIRLQFNENTLTTFETKEVYDFLLKKHNNDKNKSFKKEIKQVRRVKKIGFWLNGGTIKLSTIHSFKGWEIPTLFLIIDSDVDEAIYTAITRARYNIIIFNIEDNKFYEFFRANCD